MNQTLAASCLLLAATLSACERAGQTPGATTQRSTAGAPSPAWVLAQMPADPVGVAELKPTAKEGDHVVVRGRIGGRAEPMAEGSPVLVIMDSSLPSCADNPEDACRTPWDYCCETPEAITANNATVQVVDASGAPVSGSLAAAGLEPLAEIVVVGVVGPRPDPSVLVIRATGIHRITH